MATKWIQKAIGRTGALHRALGIPEDEKIPEGLLRSTKKRLDAIVAKGQKLTKAQLRMLRMINIALTLKKLKK